MDGIDNKYKDAEDFIKNCGYYNLFEDEEIQEIRNGNLSCVRTIFYDAVHLMELKEIPVSEIKDNKLIVNIDDFTELEKLQQDDGDAGFALRFQNSKGEYIAFKIGSNDMYQDSHSNDKVNANNLELNVAIDYSQKTSSSNRYIKQGLDLSNIFFPLIITIIIEYIVM